MRGQLEFLIEMAEAGEAIIQAVTFAAGAHEGMTGGFTVLEFDSHPEGPFDLTIGDVVYWEGPDGDSVSEESAIVDDRVNSLQRLRERALSPTESLQFVRLLHEQL
ncbi:hypothetical protein Ato02nite_016420 [Paractinoplanes toevensis]|uniref:DUF5753 domain-containing protein n=2 Tax=Paractinoplanes toevensis TaxID=571911 RepID=A0A919T8W1_9ACTN|nr:hypothetical protein Ato02nite_016420 [Actinoplanes toevensis]